MDHAGGGVGVGHAAVGWSGSCRSKVGHAGVGWGRLCRGWGAHEIHLICVQKCSQGGVGGVGHKIHRWGGVGHILVEDLI